MRLILMLLTCLSLPALAATITVDSNATGSVGGACTLQDAVKAANTNVAVQGCAAGSAGADTIVFAAGITQISLAAPMLAPVPAAGVKQYSAGLVINEDLTIDGNAVAGSGVPVVTIQRAAAAPQFAVIYAESASPINVTLAGVNISNGYAVYIEDATTHSDNSGGAITVLHGKLTVRDSVFTGNTAGAGGGIWASSIDMLYATVSGNTSAAGGGIVTGGGSIGYATISNNNALATGAVGGPGGGGIHGDNNLTIDHTSITGNTAIVGGGYTGGGRFTQSTISNNTATGAGIAQPLGGGLYAPGSGDALTLTDCVVSNNHASAAAPGVYSLGGGIYEAGPLVITRTVVQGNQSGNAGGGIFTNVGTISGSTISGNTSKGGGGIYAYFSIQIDSSEVSGNTASGGNPAALASAGGGVYSGNAVLTNVTVSGNSANLGGGLAFDGLLDALYVTITANTGATCAGLCPSNLYPGDTFTYSLINTVIAGNGGGGTDVYGNSSLIGHHNWLGSLDGAVTVAAGTSIGACASLDIAPLANNGGSTQTHALMPTSCLINAGTTTGTVTRYYNASSVTLANDQRGSGFPRVIGSHSDIGAFEYQQVIGPPSLIGVLSRKIHGAAGAMDLPVNYALPITGAITIEPRTMGAGHTLVFQFDSTVTSVSGVTAQDAALNPVGTVLPPVPSGSTVLVTLTGVPDQTRVMVSIPTVNGAASSAAAAIGFLLGDVSQTGKVTAADIEAVKTNRGNPVNVNTGKFDLNADGSITDADVTIVKSRSGLVLPP